MFEMIRKIKLAFWRGVVKSIEKDIKETKTRTPSEFQDAVLSILNESLDAAKIEASRYVLEPLRPINFS